jgi:hypothetical protein
MFESSLSMAITEWANKTKVDEKYYECWKPLKKHFNVDTNDISERSFLTVGCKYLANCFNVEL